MIVFSGLDGAGKSTQIDLLKVHMENKGSKVEMFWSRGGYTPGMEMLKACLRKSKNSRIPIQRGASLEREKSFSKPIIRKLWLSLAIVDLIFFYCIYLRVKELLGVRIICDRYLFDTQIDFLLNFPEENVSKWPLWNLLMFLSLKPQHHFILTIPVNESLTRSKLKNEPFPDSEETLTRRLAKYLSYHTSNTHHLDCSSSIGDVHSKILDHIL